MTIAELTYQKFLEQGYDGSLADNCPRDIVIRPTFGCIPFGKLTFDGLNNFVKLPDGTELMSGVVGVTRFLQVINNRQLWFPPAFPSYPSGVNAQILAYGRIQVIPEQAVLKTDPVFYRQTAVTSTGQDQENLIAFSSIPTAGAYVLNINGVNSLPINWDDVASQVQFKINQRYGPADAIVTGDTTSGFVVDWGVESEGTPVTISVFSNSLTTGIVACNISLTQVQQGFLPGTRYGVGSFRKDSDQGSAVNTNTSVKRFRWALGSDINGIAVLEIC